MEIVQPTEDDIELDFEADLRAQDAWRESQLMQETGGLGSMARGILRPGGRHTIVCKHWLRDLCMKGDKCDFLHQYDLARMPECPQWSRFGKCPDNDCDFRHDTEKMECQKYKFGFCKLGSQCRMRHDKLTRQYLPEAVPDWYLKEIIPNFYDFVPPLPEEAIRSTTGPETQAQPNLPPPMQHMQMGGHQQMWANQPMQAAAPVSSDSAWAAPVAPAWGAPVAPSYPKPTGRAPQRERAVVDLTDDRPQRGKGDRPPRREVPHQAPIPEPRDRRVRERSQERRDRPRSPPRREPERRERVPSPPRRAREHSPPRRGEADRRGERSRREEEPRRDRAPPDRGTRRRSRSYERGREDRSRARR